MNSRSGKLMQLRGGVRRLVDQGYLPVLSMNLLLQLLGFGSTILVARFLLPQELGLLRTAQAYAAVATILAGIGLTTPIMRYCADLRIDAGARLGMLGTATRAVALASSVLVLAVLGTLAWISGIDNTAARVYAIYALALPALALTSLLFVHMQATQQFSALARQQSAIKLVSVLLIVLAAWAWGLAGLLWMTVMVSYAGLLPLLRQAGPVWQQGRQGTLPADFWQMASFSLVGTFIAALGQAADFILLNALHVDGADIGRYALASIFLLAASTVTGSIQAVVTPKFTAMLGEPAHFRSSLRAWVRRVTLIGIGVALLAMGAGWLLAQWFFDQRYAGFLPLLAVLMLKYVIWSSYAVVGAALLGAGIVKPGTWVAAITTVASFALGYPLCSRFGVAGVAWMQVIVALLSLGLIIRVQGFELRRLFGRSSGRST